MRRAFGTDLSRAKYLLYGLIIVSAIAFGWLAKQSYSVYKLTRGVGDTWFHSADGKRWFRLDEQRHDVPIAAIAPSLQQAFVAVEDHLHAATFCASAAAASRSSAATSSSSVV